MTQSEKGLKKITALTCMLVTLPVVLWAKDFWEDKPFTSWSEKEALRILSDSPWGKTEHVTVVGNQWGPGQPGNPSTLPTRTIPPASGDGTGASVPGDPQSGGRTGAAETPGPYSGEAESGSRSIPFQVSWYSSTKVRQAIGRLGQLQGGVTNEQLNSFVQQPLGDHIIAVSGPAMNLLDQATPEMIKTRSFLVSKKQKSKRLALKEYTPAKQRKDGFAVFTFSQELDGKPALDVSDEEVQFVIDLPGLGIKSKFKLAKMMTDGKLDI